MGLAAGLKFADCVLLIDQSGRGQQMRPPIETEASLASLQDVSDPIRVGSVTHNENKATFRRIGIKRSLIRGARRSPHMGHDRSLTSFDFLRVEDPFVDPRQPSRIRNDSLPAR